MKTFEYCTIKFPYENWFKVVGYGKEGWELVSVLVASHGEIAYFKREIL